MTAAAAPFRVPPGWDVPVTADDLLALLDVLRTRGHAVGRFVDPETGSACLVGAAALASNYDQDLVDLASVSIRMVQELSMIPLVRALALRCVGPLPAATFITGSVARIARIAYFNDAYGEEWVLALIDDYLRELKDAG